MCEMLKSCDCHAIPYFWAAAGSVDTDLSFLSFLELYGTEIAERRMPARRVVEALDVVEHIGTGLPSCAVHLPGRALGLEGAEEALHGRVVPDLTGPAHAASDALFIQQLLEVLAGVLGRFNRSSQHL